MLVSISSPMLSSLMRKGFLLVLSHLLFLIQLIFRISLEALVSVMLVCSIVTMALLEINLASTEISILDFQVLIHFVFRFFAQFFYLLFVHYHFLSIDLHLLIFQSIFSHHQLEN